VRLGADPNAKGKARPAARCTPVCCHSGNARVGGFAQQHGNSALMLAALSGHTAAVAELVRLGAYVDAKNNVRSHCRMQ
jgi:hypothetical protein